MAKTRRPLARPPRVCALLPLALAACPAAPEVPTPPPVAAAQREAAIADLPAPRPLARRGVSLGLFASTDQDQERRAIYRTFLRELRSLGANEVQLVVRWAQADVESETLSPDPRIATPDQVLTEVIAMARAEGLAVFLMPIVHVEVRAPGKWRGTLAPKNWDRWWQSYQAFILHYARLAEGAGVELYAVGSELISTEAQEDRWRQLIAQVRGVYRGRLTYSANWDHFEPVRVWDALDVIGLTAYQPLSEGPTEEADLDRGLARFALRLGMWQGEIDRPVVITEVGYPSSAHAAARPWDQREGPIDLGLQTRCYRALYRALARQPKVEGVYLWNWFGRGGSEDGGYTLRGKPAGELVRWWFTAAGEASGGAAGAKK